jgi:hypothetical protein
MLDHVMATGTDSAGIEPLTDPRAAAMLNCQTGKAPLYTPAFVIEPALPFCRSEPCSRRPIAKTTRNPDWTVRMVRTAAKRILRFL